MAKQPCVYILCNKPHGVLYVGVTCDLPGRMYLHRQRITRGFVTRYKLYRLVYYEIFGDMYSAICREKQIKAGSRDRKIQLIESLNPEWQDLGSLACEW